MQRKIVKRQPRLSLHVPGNHTLASVSTNQHTPFLWTLELNMCVWRTLWRGPCVITAPVSLKGRKKKAPGHRGWRRNRKTKQKSTLHADSLGAGPSLLNLAGKRRQELWAKEPGKVRAPGLAGKAWGRLVLPVRMGPGGPVGPPTQGAPPPKPRPSFRYLPQR